MKYLHSFLTITTILLLYGCSKDIDVNDPADMLSSTTVKSSLTGRLPKLSYGDSIFYQKNQTVNYIIRPVRKPKVQGYFKAIPLGLQMDSLSGRINVTGSESGLLYKIYYLNVNGAKVDSTQIVISGIDYMDGIYDLGAGQDTAFPLYAANPALPLPCDDDDDDDNDNDDDGCEFDERDLDDDGTNDIPGANSLGFKVNRRNAVINLAGTITAGALGPNPQNGATGDFLFYYRLNDLSNRALQNITVRLYYYKTVGDVPSSLINELNARQTQDKMVNSTTDANYTQTVSSRPKRPPLVIIVGKSE